MSRSRTFHPSFLHSDYSATWAALVPSDAAKLAAVNWFKLTEEAHGSVWLSSSSVLIAFFILWEHKWSSPWEHASGWMPSSLFVSCKLLSVVKGNWYDSLCFVRGFRVCFLLAFFGFTAIEMVAYDISTIGIQPNVIYAHFCSHKLQDDEQWGVCSNVSCIKAKVSHHTKCLAAHRGQMWPFLNKASCFFLFFLWNDGWNVFFFLLWLWLLFVCCSEWAGLLFSRLLFKTSHILGPYLTCCHLRDVFFSALCVAPLQHLQFTVVPFCRHLQQQGQPLSQRKGKVTPSDLITNE